MFIRSALSTRRRKVTAQILLLALVCLAFSFWALTPQRQGARRDSCEWIATTRDERGLPPVPCPYEESDP